MEQVERPADYDLLDNYFWLSREVDRHEKPQALALGKLLIERLGPKSVLDVGCSSGIYLVPFREQGIHHLGIDGANGVGQHIPGNFEVIDLRTDWEPEQTYDLVYCIETAEHLRPEFADNLVRILAHATERWLFFSAARPGQNGEGHFNEQHKPYWLEKFARYGMGIHPRNDEIMQVINSDPVYEHCGWLRWNGVLIG